MRPVDRRHLLAATGALAVPLLAGPASAGQPVTGPVRHHGGRAVLTGAERAARERWKILSGRKVGVITNPTGILTNLHSIVDDMHAAGTVDVRGVFGPEHGFRGTAQAGESEETHEDPRTGITVYDAYGATVETMRDLYRSADVDTVVFDIQDVGARFYTYVWTMYTAMRAAVGLDIRFIVLDRPNPVGGTARGPMMTDGYTSGVGAERIVQAHGMTVGELARYFDREFLPDAEGGRVDDLQVVEVTGWRRNHLYEDTGLPWVMPSPNMPTPETALLYPGTGMFEGTNLSEGRGTTRPFELIGAPYVDHRWAERLTARRIQGVSFREAYFTPTTSKNEGEVCGGVQVQVEDAARLDPLRVGVEMLVALKALYGDFAWRRDEGTDVPYWIDKLTGSSRLREQVDAGTSAHEVMGAWRRELAAFERRRSPYLLYREGR